MEDRHDDEFEEEPLGDDEREALSRDLVDVQVLRELLSPKGLKGAVFFCPDCQEDHFLTWDLLAGNLRELLEQGESPIHEPAFEPDPNEYVSWDYARGFLDGYESYEQEELGEATIRLVVELKERGLSPEEVRAVLTACGLRVPDSSGGQ
ncbi:MAG: DUF5319 family protein [Actinomycetota bacterium]